MATPTFEPSYASFHFRSQRPVCFRKSFKISQLKMKILLSPTASILLACQVVLMDQGKYEQPEEMHRQASTLTLANMTILASVYWSQTRWAEAEGP
jgi:hypothetical protein